MKITDNPERLKAFCEGPFEGLCTPSEFAEIFSIDESAVRHMIRNGKLIPGKECFKFGKQWILSIAAFKQYGRSLSEVTEIRRVYLKQAGKNTIS